MIIRLQTPLGLWRVKNVDLSSTIQEVQDIAAAEHTVTFDGPLTLPSGEPLEPFQTLGELGLGHGDVLNGTVSEEEGKRAGHGSRTRRVVGEDGSILIQEYEDVAQEQGFRPGMMSLRSMKMHWTMNEFCEMDDQFKFKIRGQESSFCNGVSLDVASCDAFQQYVRHFDFQKMRIGFLYGTYLENNEVSVECIYEPPQETTRDGFEFLEDGWEERVEGVAALLGLHKVGWIFAHPPREEGFFLSSLEVITASVFQLEDAEGVNETPFVTVSVTVNPEGEAVFEGFQTSKLAMEMTAEGALEVSEHLGMTQVNSTFTAILEGKEATEIDNNMFLTAVPIKQHNSTLLTSAAFPKANRDFEPQSKAEAKQQLEKAGTQGWVLVDVLSDFNLLLYLCDYLDLGSDLPKICLSIQDRENEPLDFGFKLLLASMFEIDRELP